MNFDLRQNKVYIWFVVATILGLFFDIFKCLNKNEYTESLVAYYWVIVFSILTVQICILSKNICLKNRMLLLVAFAIRCAILFVNAFVVDIWNGFSNSGADNETYFQVSIDRYYMRPVSGEYSELAYTKFLERIYYLIGANEISSIFLNILAFTLMSWLILLFSKRMGQELDYRLFALLQLMPVTIWLNTRLLRESVISLFLVASLILFYLFYTQERGLIYFVGAIFMAFFAFCFHSGCIFFLAIYVAFAVLYYGRKLGYKFYVLALIVIGIGILVCLRNQRIIGYLTTYFTIDRLYKGLGLSETVQETLANSTYLYDFPVNNIFQLIVYVVLKYIYFWFSPMAWDIKGVAYAGIILFDALPCLLLWILCLKEKKFKPFWCILLLETVAYAVGTSAAGTAMRHRNIFVPMLIVMYIIGRKENEARLPGSGTSSI